MNRQTVNQIKLLKAIKPRPEWSVSTRDILLSQIKAQGMIHENHSRLEPVFVYTSAGLSDVYRYTFGVLFSRPRNAFVTLLLLVGTSVGLAYASESSIPGSPLYSLKKTRESLHVAVVSPEARAQLEVEIADRRLEELKNLSEEQGESAEKSKNLATLAQDVSDTLDTANHSIDSLKSEPKKLAEVATVINQKTAAAHQLLKKSTAKRTDAEQQAIAMVTQKINETNFKALGILVDKKDAAGIPESEILDQLQNKLDIATEELAALDAKVSAAGLPKDTTTTLVEKSDLAKKILDEARGSLAQKDFRVALDKLNQSNGLTTTMSATLLARHGDADVKSRDETNQNIQNKDTKTKSQAMH